MGTPPFVKNKRYSLSLMVAGLMAVGAVGSATAEEDQQRMQVIHVYGEHGQIDTATHLELTILDTPQTVTAVSSAQMEDFALDSVSEVLEYAPGVTVEEIETNRTYYTARGFDVVNFQYDGLGTPFIYGQAYGQHDAAMYERVEVVKGAAGLITGLANPSATINFVRKRPTEALQMGAKLSVNEWSGMRVDGDISGKLSDAVRGRVVVAAEDSESYLDRYEEQGNLFYGVIEVDLGAETMLTIGHSQDDSDAKGVLWGALPLLYDDGTRTDYDVSTSNAPEWTFGNSRQQQTFVELTHNLSNDWSVNGMFTRNSYDYDSELFYVWGVPSRANETGLNGYASEFKSEEEQTIYDIFASGNFDLGGRKHQLVVGYNQADVDSEAKSSYDYTNGLPVLGSDWADGKSPRPNFVDHDPHNHTADIEQEQKAFYFSSRLNATDELSVLLGARRAELTQTGVNYGASSNTDAKKTVPYYGATYLLADDLVAFGSYSEVFTQQAWVNEKFQPLGATEGTNTEIGLKRSFNNERAILTVALFQSELNNLGEYVRRDANTNTALYAARNFDSEGIEVEFSGEISRGLNIGAGLTKVDITDENGKEARLFVPSRLMKASASYRLPMMPAIKVGAVLKWQDDISTVDKKVEQGAYSLLDLALQYDVTSTVAVGMNIDNITDEKYLNSLYWDQAYYGAPRNVQASISWKY